MDQKKTGTLLRSLRLAKGLTQQQVADLLFLSPKTISKWENGDGLPDITIISSVAELYQVTVDDLLSGKIEQTQTKPIIKPQKTAIKNFIMKMDWFMYGALGIQLLGLIIGMILFIESVELGIVIISLLYLVGIAIMFIGYQNHKHALDFEEDESVIQAYNKAKNSIHYRVHNFIIVQLLFVSLIMYFISSNGLTSEIYFNPVPDIFMFMIVLVLMRKLIPFQGKVLLEKKINLYLIVLMLISVPLLLQGFNADFREFIGHLNNSIHIKDHKMSDVYSMWFFYRYINVYGILSLVLFTLYNTVIVLYMLKVIQKFEWLIIANITLLFAAYFVFYDLDFAEHVLSFMVFPTVHLIVYFVGMMICLYQIKKQSLLLKFIN